MLQASRSVTLAEEEPVRCTPRRPREAGAITAPPGVLCKVYLPQVRYQVSLSFVVPFVGLVLREMHYSVRFCFSCVYLVLYLFFFGF